MARRHRGNLRIVGKSFTALHRYARISPYKARPVVDLVRGKPVDEALSILEFQPRRAAPMIRKVIESALANATNDLEVKRPRLVVSDAHIDGGPLLNRRKRFMHRAQGRAFPIRKRTCHIVVTVAEAEIVSQQRPPSARRGKASGGKAAKAGSGAASKSAPAAAKE